MKALLPILLLLLAALIIAPWATASRQLSQAPASSSLQALVGETVTVVYLKYSTVSSSNSAAGTLISADESGLILQDENLRRFVPMHAIRYIVESK